MDLTTLKSIKNVPAEEILKKSEDGKTVITNDGTKVSDELITKAKSEKRARAAAASAASDAVASAPAGMTAEEITTLIVNTVEAAVAKALADPGKDRGDGGKNAE